MDENTVESTNERLAMWCEKMLSYRIPRWNELPEIDLYMDQVTVLMEKYLGVFYDDVNRTITPSIINNYVKLGLVPPPVKKRYSRTHIAYLLIICILKQVMPIPAVMRVIECQTEKYSLEDVYDHFCDEQERSLVGVLQQASRLCRAPEDDALIEDFILSSSIAANSSKAVSEKLIELRLMPIERKK